MTQNMDDTFLRTRRSVLLAAAGGAAAATAVALGRPTRALAADNDPLLLGADNHADGITTLTRDTINSTEDATFFAQNTISAALVGHATSGPGIVGRSVDGTGVQGFSETGAGLNGFGVMGLWADAEAFGVFARSHEGTALRAETTSGVALSTSGRLHLEMVSGIATIAAGSKSKTVTPGTDISNTTFVLLTPRGSLGGRDLWYTVDAGADAIRIRLSRSMGSALKVGWLVID